jgi:hypothetical protein
MSRYWIVSLIKYAMKTKVIKGKDEGSKIDKKKSSGITDEDIRIRAFDIYLEREPDEGTPEDDWRKSEEELYSDLGL